MSDGVVYRGILSEPAIDKVVYRVQIVGGVTGTDVMPTASASTYKKVFQYTGTTTADFTHAYFYEGDRSPTESTISASVVTGSTGISAASVVKATFEEKIEASGTYDFTYNGASWELEGEPIEDISTYGISVTTVSPTADVVDGYPEHLGTITVNATEFAGFADESGDYTFTYNSTASAWQYEGEDVTLATYGIAGIESQVESATAQQTDTTGWSLGTISVDMATYKEKTGAEPIAFIFDALGHATKIEVTLGGETVELNRDSTQDMPAMHKYFWKDASDVYYFSASADVIVGDTITKALDVEVTTVVDDITARNTSPMAGASWYNAEERVDLTEYGITMQASAAHGNQITAEYFEPIPSNGDEFTIRFVVAGLHEGDTVEIVYEEPGYTYSWVRVNVQPQLDLTSISGYDATKSQTLQHDTTGIKWVDNQ